MFEFEYYEAVDSVREKIFRKIGEILSLDKDILFAYLYGSFLGRRYFRDIDIAIWLRNIDKAFQYTIDFSIKVSKILGFPVDIQVLNSAPLSFKYHVFINGRLIFSRNEELRLMIIDEVIREYIDFNVLLKHC